MRLIYDKTTNEIKAVIAERITAGIPPSYSGDNTTYVDVDYNHKSLRMSVLARTLEREGEKLIGKTLVHKGDTITFKDQKPKQYMDTVMIDLDTLELHKDVNIYTKKAENLGVTVEIEDIDSVILAQIKHGEDIVGTIRLEKRGCCMYVYQEGVVHERKYYPHYIGFSEIIKHLQKRQIRWLDLNGFVKKDKNLNKFKKKWGKLAKIEVTWQ